MSTPAKKRRVRRVAASLTREVEASFAAPIIACGCLAL